MLSIKSRVFGLVALSSIVALVACGSSADSEFGDGTGNGSGDNGGAGNGFGNGDDGKGNGDGKGGCVGLECKQVACSGGTSTSLSGKVFDPSGTIPLYNAIVYVPNAKLAPFKEGVSCDKCGAGVSGSPITTALTDAHGAFTLKDVPVGVDFPLVVQVGRWRRQVMIPKIADDKKCTDRALIPEQTRLPRNKGEGDIPKIAITTGNADSLECFLRKLGIDDAEITNPGGTGRISMYRGLRGNNSHGSYVDGSTPSGQSLWDTPAELAKYDMVILSCEGNENNTTKSDAAKANLRDYLNVGGRVFASHFHYTWFKNGPDEFKNTATWTGNSDVGNVDINVDTSFAKGQAFSEWLADPIVNASSAPGILPTKELRRNVGTVPGAAMMSTAPDASRRWLYYNNAGAEDTKFYSFNTPIGTPAADQCGRAVYTDIHVSSDDASGGQFPNNCQSPMPALSPQEKALLFLLFDLASCIQDETKPPQPPPPAVK